MLVKALNKSFQNVYVIDSYEISGFVGTPRLLTIQIITYCN